MQGKGEIDWTWFTYARVRVLRGLAENRTQREIADDMQLRYNTVRGTVRLLKEEIQAENVRDLGRWWRSNRRAWALWCLDQAGLGREPMVGR